MTLLTVENIDGAWLAICLVKGLPVKFWGKTCTEAALLAAGFIDSCEKPQPNKVH